MQLYHVTSRGDRREDVLEDEDDCLRFLEILGAVVTDYNWLCHGYCLMVTTHPMFHELCLPMQFESR